MKKDTPPRVELAVFPRRIPAGKVFRGAGIRATSATANFQSAPVGEKGED